MRKVLFKKWVKGVELESTKGRNVQSWDRDYEKGTQCWSDFIHEGTFHDFMYNFGPHGEPYANIEHNGEMVHVETENFKFVDSPEVEQRSEFAKAAMQGIMSSNECNIGHNPKTVAEWAVSIADALISELKK